MTAAERGDIVQRVLVDGWTAEQAAATFGVEARCIALWVAAYRRHGMASLNTDAAAELAPRRWWRLLRTLGGRFTARLRGPQSGEPARSIRLLRCDGTLIRPDSKGRRSRSS